MPGRADCKDCASHYKDIKHEDPPCVRDKCPNGNVDLWRVNIFAWELWQKLSSQVIIAGMGEPLGIRFEAILALLDIYQVTEPMFREDCFEKIIAIDTVKMKYRSQELIKHKNKIQQGKNKK